MSENKKTIFSHYLSNIVSCISLITCLISMIFYVANMDKTNAIQETQIEGINKRLDRLESKIDQLKIDRN